MHALNGKPASFLAVRTKEAKLGRKEKCPFFFSSFPAYLLNTLRIYPCREGYYIEEYYIGVVIQGKQLLLVVCIMLYFIIWELTVAETHLRNGLLISHPKVSRLISLLKRSRLGHFGLIYSVTRGELYQKLKNVSCDTFVNSDYSLLAILDKIRTIDACRVEFQR